MLHCTPFTTISRVFALIYLLVGKCQIFWGAGCYDAGVSPASQRKRQWRRKNEQSKTNHRSIVVRYCSERLHPCGHFSPYGYINSANCRGYTVDSGADGYIDDSDD